LKVRTLHSAAAALAMGLALVSGLGAAQPPSAPAENLARRIQARYDTVRDFSASFEQRYVGGALRKQTVERGTVQVKKPGRMRWDYVEPERKSFVADGRRLYAHVPADRQVVISAIPAEDQASTPILFLAGKGNLVRDFSVTTTTVEGAPAGTLAIRLTPKRREREYEWLALVVDDKTMAIRMLVAGDSQGGTSSFTFTDLRENVGLGDAPFTFKIPRGTDVITQG
jgi:outer membrane lipoprotein carrier protein